MKIIGELLAYALFAFVVGLLSVWPRFDLIGKQQAIISLSFIHPGKRVGECRTLTQDELNELPPNMRKPMDCPRERRPVRVELRSGNDVLYKETVLPSGLWSDGKSNVYRRVVVDARKHNLFVGMNDSGGKNDFDYEMTRVINIEPGRNLAIGFDELEQQFRLQ